MFKCRKQLILWSKSIVHGIHHLCMYICSMNTCLRIWFYLRRLEFLQKSRFAYDLIKHACEVIINIYIYIYIYIYIPSFRVILRVLAYLGMCYQFGQFYTWIIMICVDIIPSFDLNVIIDQNSFKFNFWYLELKLISTKNSIYY